MHDPVRNFLRVRTPGGEVPAYVVRIPVEAWQPTVAWQRGRTLAGWVKAKAPGSVAINGGFFVNEQKVSPEEMVGDPLGLFADEAGRSRGWDFAEPWAGRRAVFAGRGDQVAIAWRDRLPFVEEQLDFALQAGPLLVQHGQPVDFSREGFSEDAERFDCDITAIRAPRSGIGLSRDRRHWILAVAEGYQPGLPGLLLEEWAQIFVNQGAGSAMNLDGGGSAALVVDERQINRNHDRHTLQRSEPRQPPTLICFSWSRKNTRSEQPGRTFRR